MLTVPYFHLILSATENFCYPQRSPLFPSRLQIPFSKPEIPFTQSEIFYLNEPF